MLLCTLKGIRMYIINVKELTNSKIIVSDYKAAICTVIGLINANYTIRIHDADFPDVDSDEFIDNAIESGAIFQSIKYIGDDEHYEYEVGHSCLALSPSDESDV